MTDATVANHDYAVSRGRTAIASADKRLRAGSNAAVAWPELNDPLPQELIGFNGADGSVAPITRPNRRYFSSEM